MKRLRFSELFLLASVVIYIASEKGIFTSILLMLASVYMIIDTIRKYRKEKKKKCQQETQSHKQ